MHFGPEFEQFDPALLAFVKCHVTSPQKWEVLRVLASQEGTWLSIGQITRATHKDSAELDAALAELVGEGVVEQVDGACYRLPLSEPTSVVLRRLLVEATRSREMRAIIVACLQRSKLGTLTARAVA